ncbi:MAG: hypothetical protein GFH27_549293n48 [Chloroflexi bacterium AL-W]|nr:hypothetical protein [Chloroflexi bacterium AL-N1]NOK67838.1 hypothetical protein [Chloroflexi bacterium AL-N10]NOK75393.1 hypothetical protein [Chloroflexi bacterium AL-N5]NOK82181.1 hypothetical protein [Chloroflexi bacterium AL-W]NOK90026.1 hypothetical protein [Chloroflexi bacterium AL-N15]
MFQFGDSHKVVDRQGQPHEFSAYVLHLRCAWRIVGLSGIVVASCDTYYPSSDKPLEDAYADDFAWGQQGANRCVESIRADAVGSLWIQLESEYALEVFPDDSLGKELWRFFEPHTKNKHFVVMGSGIE